MHSVLILSGGLDSTTLLYWLRAEGYEVSALGVDYGQRHVRELQAASALCATLHIPWTHLTLPLEPILGKSALTNPAAEVPEGHYAAPSMQATVVPNRNMLLLALAGAHAVQLGAEAVAYAAHAGDHPIYPDCRPAFVEAMHQAFRSCAAMPLHLVTPFLHWSKADIVRLGAKLGVPFATTWSCYQGGRLHCGRCGTDVERKLAFKEAGVPDPTVYEDPAYGMEWSLG